MDKRKEKQIKKTTKEMRKAIAKFTNACDKIGDCSICPFHNGNHNCNSLTLFEAMCEYNDNEL